MTEDKINTTVADETGPAASEFLARLGAGSLAYIRSHKAGDLAETVPQVRDLPPSTVVYGVYGADGDPILLTKTMESAIAGAQAQELTPVTLH